MNEKQLKTSPPKRRLPEWMSMPSKRCAVEERKVCSSPIILSDGKSNVNLTVK